MHLDINFQTIHTYQSPRKSVLRTLYLCRRIILRFESPYISPGNSQRVSSIVCCFFDAWEVPHTCVIYICIYRDFPLRRDLSGILFELDVERLAFVEVYGFCEWDMGLLVGWFVRHYYFIITIVMTFIPDVYKFKFNKLSLKINQDFHRYNKVALIFHLKSESISLLPTIKPHQQQHTRIAS